MNPSDLRQNLVCLFLLMLGIASVGAAGKNYHQLRKYTFGPAEGSTREYFDYIAMDSPARRVYLSPRGVRNRFLG